MNDISQRDAFWNKIYELAKNDKDIIIVTADMGAPSLDKFRRDLPSQFINVGIAEQNAITLSAGLVMSGKKVFTYAISPFITIRCLEQIRVESGIMNIPINIVGVGVGFGYDDSGPTHHLIEDIAMLRSIPNIKIHTITDSVMASAFAEIVCNNKATNYVRIYRQTLPDIYSKEYQFFDGLSVLEKAKDFYIISSGSMVHESLKIVKKFKSQKIDIGLIDLYSITTNEEMLLQTIKNTKRIFTIEENFLPGGIGSYVCEILADNDVTIPVKRLGLLHKKSYCYTYGGINEIRKYYGISNTDLEKTIQEYLK